MQRLVAGTQVRSLLGLERAEADVPLGLLRHRRGLLGLLGDHRHGVRVRRPASHAHGVPRQAKVTCFATLPPFLSKQHALQVSKFDVLVFSCPRRTFLSRRNCFQGLRAHWHKICSIKNGVR